MPKKKVYEVTWYGKDNQIYSIGKMSFPHGKTFTFSNARDLPLPLRELRRQPGMQVKTLLVTKAEVVKEPNSTIKKGTGIRWTGSAPVRATEFGLFRYKVVRTDLTAEQIEILAERPFFEIIKGE